ncbi:MAG TPA: hypothetical protein VGJ29_05260 [Vicinamibacterales bacterium]
MPLEQPTAAPVKSAAHVLAGIVAAIGGAIAALHYHRLGLTLSHYDARGHLVVARRIFDSITPGWQQIGAVWLPLPHLLNALPVQVDLLYRTGASGVAISIVSFAVAAAAICWIVIALTGSVAASFAALAIFALNPNVVYLQATPMTEPLLLATTTVAVALLIAWCESAAGRPRDSAWLKPRATGRATPWVGWAFALACLTRYEAWPITCCALAAAAWTLWRRGATPSDAIRRTATIAMYPALAIVGFALFSRVVVGEWFVTGGFFVPENKSLGQPLLALKEVGWGVKMLSGTATIWIAAVGVGAMTIAGLVSARRSSALIALSLGASAALPWSAFVKGHPFRIRYMVPLIAIEAIGAGFLAGLFRRAALVGSVALALVAVYDLRPFDRRAPMVVEAQWDLPNRPVRQRVTDCLLARRDGEKIMASMGSLGHYMQEASASGFRIRDYLHEGNGDIWLAALETPEPYAGWVLIEEKAEGGDMLAAIAREQPHWLDGYSRVCDGAGLALYRRNDKGKGQP